jgi:hypothetical protein
VPHELPDQRGLLPSVYAIAKKMKKRKLWLKINKRGDEIDASRPHLYPPHHPCERVESIYRSLYKFIFL